MEEEINRIKEVYSERAISSKIDYNPALPANNYFIISKEKLLAKLLYKFIGTDFSNVKILDVGFGNGSDLLTLIKYGFSIKNIYGVEVLHERFEKVKEILPAANLTLINGFSLPYTDNSMDLIIQSTVFSSILDLNSRKQLATEMYRVLKTGGKIFSYDMRISNPWNKNVIKIDKNEIKQLFPAAEASFYTLTLNPVIARRIANYSIVLCEIFDKIPTLCSHYYTVIQKN